jgi:hypothetical protein
MTAALRRPRRAARALTLLAVVLGLGLLVAASRGTRDVAPAIADSPALTLALTPSQNPVAPQIKLTATTALPSASIDSIDFEYAPADSGTWTSLGMNPQLPGGLPPYTVKVDTTQLTDGLYDFRAKLTDGAGAVDFSPTLRDQLVANSSPVVTLSGGSPSAKLKTGSAVRLTVPLSAVETGTSSDVVSTISFQISPANQEQWTAIATLAVASSSSGEPAPVTDSLDTTTVPDGVYDLRAVPFDATGEAYATIPIRGVIVDNTPPTVSLLDPGSPLTGTVTLTTQASDAGSGVASVEFQAAKSGTGVWEQIGERADAPFSDSLDTTSLDNGAYDFRAIATDAAGNVAISNLVTDTVSNPPQPPPVATTIEGVALPAHDVTMLGSVDSGSTQETWAYGFTSAPPASVDGQPLPYTAEGDQFVLLRYTAAGGWQIADVPRNPDDSAFQFIQGGGQVTAVGEMAASGEAWLWIEQASGSAGGPPVFGLFHRVPGGSFVLDPTATAAVGPALLESLTGAAGQLRLGQAADGTVYGILTAPNQPAQAASVPSAAGTPVTVDEQLEYALLANGTWTRETAPLPATYSPVARDTVTIREGDVSGPSSGWGALSVQSSAGQPAPNGLGLLLGQFDGDQWTYTDTGLDALDLTGAVANPLGSVTPTGLKTDGSGVWIGADVRLPGPTGTPVSHPVVARYDAAGGGAVTNSWCSLPVASSCDEPLDADHPAAVPDAVFDTAGGSVALSLQLNALHVFSRGTWSVTPVPGYLPSNGDTFSGPSNGWLGGQTAAGQVVPQSAGSAGSAGSLLSSWPIAVRSPLTSVALPPGGNAAIDESGALAVGLDGTTLEYDASAGWVVEPTPPRAHHINIMSVAFDGPSSAFAVGQFGLILHWDGSSWSEDPASISLTEEQLNSVAFSSSGEGWAVGADGTILHYDGTSWSIEQPPALDASTDITSVAVAGSDVFAIADGNLITRESDGTWTTVDPSVLPTDPAPVPGSLRLVSGLPDGGAVIAGVSVVLERGSAGAPFEYSAQPLEGIAVGLAAFRAANGSVGAAVSLAPPAASPLPPYQPTDDIGGFPAGDGELLIETAAGWQDLSRSAQAGQAGDLPPDGEVKPDPVLAVAASPDGQSAWAVGGYDGTPAASGLGTATIQPARPAGWQTASLWRYDAGGSASSPALSDSTPSIPATPGTVSFAFFSSPLCRVQCADTADAQPDTNLAGAIGEISAYAAQPGGPSFAMLGGDAVGPSDTTAWGAGNGATDFTQLPGLLAPLTVPLFAAIGPLDAVPTETDPDQSWSNTFAGAPAPFGSGPAPPGIAPVSAGAPDGVVSRYYAFDASQNGGTIRVIVLDNSKGSLEASDAGQTAWLGQQLAAAQAAGLPIVAVTALPLSNANGDGAADGPSVAATLASAGVLAVFTSDSTEQFNEVHQVPDNAVTTIPEYEGASLGYQQPQNDGVVWYDVSVDTQARTVAVNAVPVIQSLALQPLTGLSVARSLTLQFQAIGRRPAGSLATAPEYSDQFAGYDNYAEIPSPGCGGVPCITPTYAFASSDPTIGNFVTPSGPGSPYPKLGATGHPIANSESGLFCAYNAGTTTVSVTAGLLTYSLTVTVAPGGFGAPCGTVAPAAAPAAAKQATPTANASAAAATPPPPPAAATAALTPVIKLPPQPAPAPVVHHAAPVPRPVPVPAPAPATPAALPAPQLQVLPVFPSIVPPITPAQPIPPGGATAPSSAPARRREKAHRKAESSAFTTLTPGTGSVPSGAGAISSGDGSLAWYYGAVGLTTLLTLMLAGQGLRPRRRPAEARIDGRRR